MAYMYSPSIEIGLFKRKKNFMELIKKIENDIKKLHKKFLILRIGTILMYDTIQKKFVYFKSFKSLKNNNVIEMIYKNTYKDFLIAKSAY